MEAELAKLLEAQGLQGQEWDAAKDMFTILDKDQAKDPPGTARYQVIHQVLWFIFNLFNEED